MNSTDEVTSKRKNPLIWDWPLRVWHWLIALSASTALLTGLVKKWDAMDLHRWAGISVVALLLFRLLWAVWGGTYARIRWYFTSPSQVVRYFAGREEPKPHTPPGIALAICMFLALGTQAVAGLFTTDDVFIDGPFVQFASDEVVEFATDLHHQVWWLVIALIAIHLTAHAVYGAVLRSPIPLSMFSGRKPTQADSAEFSLWLALVSFAVAAVAFWVMFSYIR